MFNKFIYVFNEADKNVLLSHGYELIQEPKPKKVAPKKKSAKDKEGVEPEEVKEAVKYWVFLNKSTRDTVFNSIENYVFSDTLTL